MERPVIVINRDGVIVDLNAAARTQLGGAPGRRCADVVMARQRNGLPICGGDCATELIDCHHQLDRPGVRIRSEARRLTCTGLGETGVVTILDAQETASAQESLTPREREVLALVARGLTSRRIAQRLGLSVSTIRTHVERCRDKLGASSRAEAVATALRQGQIAAAK